jgi:restriction system protein
MLDNIAFNGRVSTTDPATGRPVRPSAVTVVAQRAAFADLVLASRARIRDSAYDSWAR